MAALINALDSSCKLGNKGHVEYAWSNDIKEKILQLSFQFTRCDSSTIESLSTILRQTLKNLQNGYKNGQISADVYKELMTVTYKMVGHTRNIIDGKGEYALAYMQILVWNEFSQDLAQYALLKFVSSIDSEHPYGSWKDIKYFCNYCRSKSIPTKDPLMQYAFGLINSQIEQDMTNKKTLAAKWVPREKSTKFGWIFNELAFAYFSKYIESAKTPEQKVRAALKCKTEYRKLISKMNKELGTTQINQCANTWADIDHAKTTSITISKQKKAFLNIKKDGTQRSEFLDRIKCAENFTERIKKASRGEIEIKGKRVGMNQFTTQAFELIARKNRQIRNIDESLQTEIDLLNSQWRDNAMQTGSLCEMIAMVDFSGSMEGAPRDCAMALGCRVAEKSILGKRILSFSTNPTWHNLDKCNTFVEMIEVLQNGEVGYSTNFYKALYKILDAIIEKKLLPEQVSGMVLAIFSDMQIDAAEGTGLNMSFYDVMTEKYAAAGMRLYGVPFKPPHILFWNLSSTQGFPTLSTQPNVSMMSGFSPALLNFFCERGLDAFQDCTPWSCLVETMNKPRYQCLEDRISTYIG